MSCAHTDPRATPSRPRRHERAALWCALAVGVLALSSCGGAASTSSSGSATSKQEQARLDAAKCLRQHGVNVPDPGTGGQGGPPPGLRNTSPQVFQAARQACLKYIRQAFTPLSPADRTKFRDAFVKYAACMRANGVNIPDPQPGAGPGQGPGRRLFELRSQPNFRAADAKCQSLRPRRPGGGGFGGPRGPGGPGGPGA